METKEKNKKLLIVVGVLLVFVSISLAYFISKAILGGNGGNASVTTANIKGATLQVAGVLSFEDLDILPGHQSVSAISVTATGNNDLIPYNLIWRGTNTLTTPLKFTIYKTSEPVTVKATCEDVNKTVGSVKQLSETCTISNIDKLGTEVSSGTINKNDTKVTLVKDEFITATSTGLTMYYYVILEYPNLDEPQNYDLEGSIEGEVTVEESTIKPDITVLAAYVKQEDGTYKEVDDIPQSGYQLNTSKSTCSNGTIPGWNSKEHMFYTTNLTKSGTSCYLYFDEKTSIDNVSDLISSLDVNTSTPDFSQAVTTDEGVYSASDGMYGGTSYYWRGASTTNHVIFANKCWRIVRINGDGSIRLIYNGAVSSGTCTGNGSNAGSIAVASQAYNSSSDRSEYVGWTYSTGNQRTTSGTVSNIKSQTDTWYNNNIGNNDTYKDKVVDGKFCNDRNTGSGYTWSSQPSSTFYYAGYDRSGAKTATSVTPTLSCPEGDVYELKAGAITMDEVVMAGAKYGTANSSYYLYNGQYYWTMSPHYLAWYESNRYAYVFIVRSNGQLTIASVNDAGISVRPVINLKADTTFATGGNGTQNNPYVVS